MPCRRLLRPSARCLVGSYLVGDSLKVFFDLFRLANKLAGLLDDLFELSARHVSHVRRVPEMSDPRQTRRQHAGLLTACSLQLLGDCQNPRCVHAACRRACSASAPRLEAMASEDFLSAASIERRAWTFTLSIALLLSHAARLSSTAMAVCRE